MPISDVKDPITAPAIKGFSITPNDSVDLAITTRGIYVGSAGNLKVLFYGDTSPVTLSGVSEGAFYPFAIKRVYATGTTAANIVGVA